jgi:hypothetical protein
MTRIELWLPVGAIAFYLYDSVRLLWQNEMIYVWDGTSWRVRGGTPFRLSGRRIYLPNILSPQRLEFLVRWSETDPRGSVDSSTFVTETYSALRPVRYLVLILAALLFCALPLISWLSGAGLVMLVLFAVFYSMVFAALFALYRVRRRCELPIKAFWAMAFDALACAPFAVNLMRKISLRRGLAGNPLLFARQHFDPFAKRAVAELVTARAKEELENIDPTSTRKHNLERLLRELSSTLS